MNKNKFRIVFNKNRGQMMAVAESASSQGKAASGQTTLTTAGVGLLLGIALGGSLGLVSLTATAQVVANTAAPANQRPEVTTTASGVTQVNIQTAVGGVSRNRYTQFDVGAGGVILNNSPVNSNTKLAGWVAGNNNLASGSASIILNEVNSPNASQIRGFIEVAGQRAEVIVANPSGIAVNGGGFINASAATLTTGTPQFSGNTLTGYQVNGGTITVSGAGLDTATAGITTLQAQKIMLQGGVWAQDLRVLGDNSAGTANAVAIDVAAIGGMYANKITILANGQGAGVNNAGVLQANSGSFTLSADGTLTNTGTIDSSATTRINATTVNNSTAGAIYGGSVAIGATTLNNAATSPTATAPVIAARDTTGRVDLGVQTLNNQEGALIYSAGSLNIGGSLDANGQATGRATTVTNNSATLEAKGNVAITTQNFANTYTSLRYRTEVDPTKPAESGTTDCGVDCWHNWTDTFYRAVAIEGPNGAAVVRSGADIALDASVSANNRSSKILAAGTVGTTGAALSNRGIDLTDEVRTRRANTVVLTWMDNNVNCRFGRCESVRRWSTTNSTTYQARDQTIAPATRENNTTSTSTTAALPNSALFKTSSSNSYLIQTDPRFTNKQIWLSSDYMLQNLTVDPDITQKRMGDGFYEQRLINEQIAQLTGYARLANYSSDEQQYQALMSSGITAASALNLRVGIALTAEQVAQLTSDMVWLVQREVTLADGSTQKVLVPQVYAVARAGDLSNTGALLSGMISGNVLNINAGGDIEVANGATMAGRVLVNLDAANVNNLGARIQGQNVFINASQDIQVLGGAVIAKDYLSATAGRDLIVQSTTQDSTTTRGTADTSAPATGTAPTNIASAAKARPALERPIGARQPASEQAQAAPREAFSVGARQPASEQAQAAPREAFPVGARPPAFEQAIARPALELPVGAPQPRQALAAGTLGAVGASAGAGAGKGVSGALGSYGGGTSSANVTISSTDISRVAGLYVTGEAGTLLASAGRDVKLLAALLQSAGSTQVTAARDIQLATVTTSAKLDATLDAGNYNRTSRSAEVGTTLQSTGTTTLAAGRNVSTRAADAQAAANLNITAGADVTIEAGTATNSVASSRVATNSGFLSSSKRTDRQSTSTTTALASNLGAKNITITSGKDLGIKGSNVTADQDVTLNAANNITIDAATNTQTSTRYSALSESGLMNSGDMSATIGTRDKSTDTKSTSTSAAASTIGSVGGNVVINAGNTYTQRGSDIVAAGNTAGTGNVAITAKKLDIVEAREAFTTSTEQKMSQTGVTLAIQNSAVQGAQTVQNMDQSMMKTKSARMKALGAASAVMAAKEAMNSPMGEVTASLTFGTSESQSNTSFTSNTARGSNVTAAGNVTLQAIGAGKDSNLTIQGSTVKAGDTTTLEADNEVNLLAAANTTTQTSSQKSSSASAGISASSGKNTSIGVSGSLSMASGSGNGTEVTYTNTQVSAGKKAVIKSGGNTTLRGAVVEAPIIQADVGGNLNIESLQDTSRYNESSQNVSASVTVGKGVTGSLSLGATKIDSNYASVTQQSALRAGDGGFQVNVAGNTDLKGGAITSSDKAVNEGKNTFQTAALTTSDIQNSASFKADSFAVTIGTSGGSAGMGKDSGSANSTTKAGISGIAGNKAARTGDAETGIEKIFDATKVKDEVNAQVQITQEFGKQASKAVGDFAAAKTAPIDNARTYLQLKGVKDPSEIEQKALSQMEEKGFTVDSANAALNDPQNKAAYENWKEGGAARVALHTMVGGLGGGTSGALGAATSQTFVPMLGEKLAKLDIPVELKNTLIQVAGTTIGAVTGGTGGAVAGQNATANNYLSHVQVENMLKALEGAKTQKDRDIILARYTQLSKDQSSAVSQCVGSACTQIQTDIEEGQKALSDARDQIATYAGGVKIFGVTFTASDNVRDLGELQRKDSIQVSQNIAHAGVAARNEQVRIQMGVSKPINDAITKGESCATAQCRNEQFKVLQELLSKVASSKDRVAIVNGMDQMAGLASAGGECIQGTTCNALQMTGGALMAVVSNKPAREIQSKPANNKPEAKSANDDATPPRDLDSANTGPTGKPNVAANDEKFDVPVGNSAPPLFRGGNSLEARLGVDVKPASDGLIHPNSANGKPQGLSLNLDPKDQFIQKYGGAFPVERLPEGLQVIQSGKPGHYVIAPSAPMTFDNYQQLLKQVQLANSNKIP
jgi:filamentous hemagglutinin